MRIFEKESRTVSKIARIGQSERSRNGDRGWKWLKRVEKGFAENKRRLRRKVSESGQCEHHQGRERLKEFAESRDSYCERLQRNGRTDAKRKITERWIQLKDMGESRGRLRNGDKAYARNYGSDVT
jgi:hypothetical protein